VPFLTGVLIRPSLYDASKWIDTARPRPIRIDSAAGFTHKGTTQIFTFPHLQCDDWQARPWADVVRGIAMQEFSRGAFQISLQPKDVVRGQELIEVTTTAIETYDSWATSKMEGVI